MASDWTSFCRAADFVLESDVILVKLADGRQHRVHVRDAGATLELSSVVAKPSQLQGLENVPLLAWRRNRNAHLVGFRLDKRQRLVGEAWVPVAGLSADEFQGQVRRLAAECDRFEYLLTGADTH